MDQKDLMERLEELKEQVKGLRGIVEKDLAGAKEDLPKRKGSEDFSGQQHQEWNISVLEEGLKDLGELERDVDRCMGAPNQNQLGCNKQDLCKRYRDICNRMKSAAGTLASGQPCTC